MGKLSPKKANIFAVILLIWTLLFSICSGVLIVLLGILGIDIEQGDLILIVIQDLFIILIPVLIFCAASKTKLNDLVPSTPLTMKNVIYIFALTLLMFPVIMFVSSLTNIFYSSYDNNALIYGFIDKLPMGLCVLALAVMPAVFEELAFRGVVLSNYKSIGIIKAAIISAFFFGLFHMDLYQIPYAIVAGVYFALIVAYTNSIYASMLAHFIINGSQVIQAKLLFSADSNAMNDALKVLETSTTQTNIMASLMMLLLCCITVPLLISLFKKFKQYNENNYIEYIHYKKDDVYYIDTEEIDNTKIFTLSFWGYVVIALVITVVLSIIK